MNRDIAFSRTIKARLVRAAMVGAIALSCSRSPEHGTASSPSPDREATSDGPELLFDLGPGEAYAFRVDADRLYFSGPGGNGFLGASVKTGAKTGGAFTAIGPWNGMSGYNLITSDRDAVFWLNGDKIVRYAKQGGALTELALDRHDWQATASDDEFVYVGAVGCKALGKLAKADGSFSVTEIPEATGTGSNAVVVIDGSNVYCSHLDRIFVAPRAGGPAKVLVSGQKQIQTLGQDESALYFIDTGPSVQSPQRLVKVDKSSGDPVELTTSSPGGMSPMLHVDAVRRAIYWEVSVSFDDEIRAFYLDSGTTKTLLQHRSPSGGFVGDGDSLYWGEKEPPGKTHERGLVYRMRKPGP